VEEINLQLAQLIRENARREAQPAAAADDDKIQVMPVSLTARWLVFVIVVWCGRRCLC